MLYIYLYNWHRVVSWGQLCMILGKFVSLVGANTHNVRTTAGVSGTQSKYHRWRLSVITRVEVYIVRLCMRLLLYMCHLCAL